MDRDFENDKKGFRDIVRILPVDKVLVLVESQIKDFIERCNSLDPHVDLEIFDSVMTRKDYQKRINFLKNWLFEQGFKYDESIKRVVKLNRRDKKNNLLRRAFFKLKS